MLQKYDRVASKHVYDIATGDESWIYSYEPESKQHSNVWVFQEEPNPTKLARTQSTSKQMIAGFFGKIGHVAIVPLKQHRTVNSDWYTIICLPVVFQGTRKTKRQRRITFHNGNVSSYTSAQTMTFLSTQNIDLMSHPLYSPDLAPNDFFLFPHVKKNVGSTFFDTWRSGWCVQNACFGDTASRVAKVLPQLVQSPAKVFRF